MIHLFDDTIAAPATIPGTGAVTLIRVSGPEAFRVVDEVVSLSDGTVSESAGYSLHFGSISGLDDVLVSVFRAPRSYTGEDAVEISCHASEYIAREILSRLIAAGARMAEPGEFTRRAFMNGKMDLSQAEAVADVIASNTSASHRVAYHQLKGGFSAELNDLREQLLEMASLLELELDFSEEDVEFADRSRLLLLLDSTIDHVRRLTDSFRLGNVIKKGIPVAIAGAANSGKSTLLNTLLGEERAIVSDVAGTTRDTIEECVNIDGILFRFVDTAGIRETSETVEKMGIDRTFSAISHAQIVLGVLDGTLEESVLWNNARQIYEAAQKGENHLVLLLNKADLSINKNVINTNKFVSLVDNKDDVILISAKTGLGIDLLRRRLFDLEKGLVSNQNSTFVTNVRHYDALVEASDYLQKSRSALAASLPGDLISEDLRLALRALGSITGAVTDSEILGRIFSTFCIGK